MTDRNGYLELVIVLLILIGAVAWMAVHGCNAASGESGPVTAPQGSAVVASGNQYTGDSRTANIYAYGAAGAATILAVAFLLDMLGRRGRRRAAMTKTKIDVLKAMGMGEKIGRRIADTKRGGENV